MKGSGGIVLALSSCLLAVNLVLAPAAQAGSVSAGQPLSERVRMADLNLASSADVQILYGRIRRAAYTVCQPFAPVGTLAASGAWYVCVHQAIARAVQDVNRPLLTAYYERQQEHDMGSGRLLSRVQE